MTSIPYKYAQSKGFINSLTVLEKDVIIMKTNKRIEGFLYD